MDLIQVMGILRTLIVRGFQDNTQVFNVSRKKCDLLKQWPCMQGDRRTFCHCPHSEQGLIIELER